MHDTDFELAEIFSEFKEGLEQQSGSPTEGEDPETHYNLGVAFKEMGLLDEAIGELQKVCQAVERGPSPGWPSVSWRRAFRRRRYGGMRRR
jgi:hypothetical protein